VFTPPTGHQKSRRHVPRLLTLVCTCHQIKAYGAHGKIRRPPSSHGNGCDGASDNLTILPCLSYKQSTHHVMIRSISSPVRSVELASSVTVLAHPCQGQGFTMCVPGSLLSHRSRSGLVAVCGDPAACGGLQTCWSRESCALYLYLCYRGTLYRHLRLDHPIYRHHTNGGVVALPAKLQMLVSCNVNLSNRPVSFAEWFTDIIDRYQYAQH
jgi:hypothetical protein